MAARKVLIAGASGLIGHATARHFASLPGWEVVGVSRRVPAGLPSHVELHSLDLLDPAVCERTVNGLADVTHLVFAALHEVPNFRASYERELIERNAAMLRNLFEPLSRVATRLEHVTLMHGTKAYGVHLPGLWETARIPLRERDPRVEHENFYFLQEEYLREKQPGGSWRLTMLRPTVVYGDAADVNMNPLLAIAVYAALQREAGEPLYFPGRRQDAWLHEAVDADLLARAIEWAAEAPGIDGEAFNVTNGDLFLWENTWPAIADSMGMAAGEHRPVKLSEELVRRDGEWAAIVDRYGLRAPRSVVDFVGYNSLLYADRHLASRGRGAVPMINSTIKIRQAGFHDCIDTEDMFRRLIRRLQDERLIPPRE